jgi:hypothetical protein
MVWQHAAAVPIRGYAQLGIEGLVIGEYQDMTVAGVLVVPGDAFFRAQPLDELKIAFPILGAIFARQVGFDMEGEGIGVHAMFVENRGDDLRHRQVLENSMIMAVLEEVERRYEANFIASQAFADIARRNVVDQAVNAFTARTELEERRLAEKIREVEVGVLADQINMNGVEGADGFSAGKFQHLEIVSNIGDLQYKALRFSRIEHVLVLKQAKWLAMFKPSVVLACEVLLSTLASQEIN